LGIFMVLLGVPMIIYDGGEIMLMFGLFTIFNSKEKIEDERSLNLKVTSLYFSFFICYATKLFTSLLYENGSIGWELVEINHFIIAVFAVGLITYYPRLYFLSR